MVSSNHKNVSIFWRLLKQARPHWKRIVFVLALGLMSTPLSLLNPLPLKIVVDNVLSSKPLPDIFHAFLPSIMTESPGGILAFAIILVVIVGLLAQVFQALVTVFGANLGQRLTMNFRAKIFDHVQRLSFPYHDSRGTADSLYRIQYDATSIQWLLTQGIIPFTTSLAMLAAMIYVTAQISWQLALVALTVAPILLAIMWLFQPYLQRQWHGAKNLETISLSVIQEVLSGLRVVKAFGQEGREVGRFMQRSNDSVKANIRLNYTEGSFNILIGLTTAVGTAVVLFLGVRFIQSTAMTLGDLLLVMGYLALLYGPLNTIARTGTMLQGCLASAERAYAVLDQAPDVPEIPDARPIKRAVGNVAFHGVSFAYDSSKPVLDNITFTVNTGTKVGVVGATGAGKTTLCNLLTRLYDPTSGEILLDGIDLRNYKLNDLRNQFSVVLQDPVLFSTTIAENIAYGRPDASKKKIVEAAKAANVHEFIIGLPEGYQTLVGERGMRLSGGERQRISLARAFLKDAPILILDEPTSSVDVETEAAIMEAMGRLTSGRTSFLITHRLAALKGCDVLIRLNHGEVSQTKDNEETSITEKSYGRKKTRKT